MKKNVVKKSKKPRKAATPPRGKAVKPVRKIKQAKPIRPAHGKPIGVVTHFYGDIEVAIVKFKKPMKIGAVIKIKGATTDLEQKIGSMQYDHKDIAVAKKGQEVGMKVDDKVRDGDEIFE